MSKSDAAFASMEDEFYVWWESVLSHYTPERRAKFEADVGQYVIYENFAREAFMAGVKTERFLAEKRTTR